MSDDSIHVRTATDRGGTTNSEQTNDGRNDRPTDGDPGRTERNRTRDDRANRRPPRGDSRRVRRTAEWGCPRRPGRAAGEWTDQGSRGRIPPEVHKGRRVATDGGASDTGTDTKHYETDERSPPLRLSSRNWDGSPNTFIIAEEKRDGSWCRVGSVELSVGPVDARGVFAADVLAEWSFTRFHAAGDRVVVDRRLVPDNDAEHYRVKLEEQRRQVLGTGRREHSWAESQFWEWQRPVPAGRA